MTFPEIKNIKDITNEHSQDFLEDNGYIFIYKDNYTVIDYVVTKERTFETPLMCELRGIKFCSQTGNIIARPLHKFFNVGETKCKLDDSDFSRSFVYEKLDGSMVHTTKIGATWDLHTRKGSSEQALMALEFLNTHDNSFLYDKFIQDTVDANATAVFEYVSPDNRIVVEYPEDDLILIAVRDNRSGNYLDYRKLGQYYGIPFVRQIDVEGIPLRLFVNSRKNFEGIVIRSGDEFAKIKNIEYVVKHRTLDKLKFEKDLIEICVNNLTDDIMPLVDEEVKNKIIEYNNKLNNTLMIHRKNIFDTVHEAIKNNETRKGIAKDIKDNLPGYLQALAFKYLDSLLKENTKFDLTEELKTYIYKSTSSSTKIKEHRQKLLKGVPEWSRL